MATDNKNKVLNVPHLRFPEFSGEWERKRLKDVCNIRTGNKNTQDKSDNGIYPFYVRSQIVERINSWTFDGEAILTAGDGVGVGKVFHYSTGKIGVHQRVYILSDFKCDGKYLYSYFAGNFYNRVKRMSAKNSVDSVRMEMIADMPIALPSIEEQKKIGHLLALLDDRITTQNKIIEDLKILKSSIIDICYKGDDNIRLGEFISQVSHRNKLNHPYKVMSVSNIRGFIPQSEQFTDREIASENTTSYKIVTRDIFAYNPARINIGSIARFKGNDTGIVSPMYVCFRVSGELLPQYLEYFFQTQKFRSDVELRLEGSVRLCLNFDALCGIEVPILSPAEQIAISSAIETLESKIVLEQKALSLMNKQRKYLLSKLFI